ncbi:MAG: hypothetical protein M3235_21810 [Actinomycetota bacterium]|nr:hypothetical protein [Actinomycetota bacterium]
MTAPDVPVADRLRRIASVRLARPLPELSDPTQVAVRLGAVADPPLADAATVGALADALSGAADALPATVADRLTSGLGLPGGALDTGAEFEPVEVALLREFLDHRGVVDVRSCRGGHGRSALLGLVGLVDRCATGPAGS